MSRASRSFKRNRPLWIGIISVVSVILVIAIGIGAYLLTPAGKASYQAIDVPENSAELTAVPEAPVGRLDDPEDDHIGVDMLGQQVDVDDVGVDPNDTTSESAGAPSLEQRTREMNQVSNLGQRFEIPSVGLDVPLGALTMVDDLVEPTNFTSVFQIRNLGVPYTNPSEGTVYLATHALDVRPDGNVLSYNPGGLAPGNFFFDTSTGDLTVSNGDEIIVGDRAYEVTGSERIGKGVINQDKELWDSSISNRLVILLCQPDSNDNHVVYAEPAPQFDRSAE